VALLVIMGFSVHDTIVVFDRIRDPFIILLCFGGSVEIISSMAEFIFFIIAKSFYHNIGQ